jgi:uncharacterized oligopeptide transporter (OPT) family protein
MGLFQKAPRDEAEASKWGPLEVGPEQVKDFTEEQWYARVYRGPEAPQLTWRAIIMGSILGFFLAFTNLYIGLKTGWGLGVAITACILSYAIWSVLLAFRFAKSPMTILENNCMQSTASSAGYATGGTVVSAITALLMLSPTADNPKGEHLPWYILAGWTFFLGVLGTVLAIPMKRNMINRERLPFPSGLAAATTLQSLYSEGKEALAKAKALVTSAVFGAVFPLLNALNAVKYTDEEGKPARKALIHETVEIFDFIPGRGVTKGADGAVTALKPSDWLISLETSPVMMAAGAIMGLRTTTWMLIAGLGLAYGLGPWSLEQLWTNPDGKVIAAVTAPAGAWRQSGLWFGAPLLVASGLMYFVLQWRTIVAAIRGAGGGETGTESQMVKDTEVPMAWMWWGGIFGGTGVILIGHFHFHIPAHLGLLAVGMTFILSLVACRATGETDITPIGAMGKLMQLTYGVLIPQNATANLMTASITSSSAGSAADLLNDLKAGYLLGANPRRQFIAQFLGVFMGTVATTFGFYLLVPDATAVTGDNPAFPAPAATSWKAVAEVFKNGLDHMHPTHQTLIYYGLAAGVFLVLLEANLPQKLKKWVPSASGIGLGLILPCFYPISMFIGATAAWAWQKTSAKSAERFLVPVAAGIIAGAALMGVIVAILNNTVFK